METFKSLLLSALVLATLASSSLSMGPSYGTGPIGPQYQMSAEAQQFPDELQQQNDMANDPDGVLLQQMQQMQQMQDLKPGIVGPPADTNPAAVLQALEPGLPGPYGVCYQHLYILAFTSGFTAAGSDDRAYVQIRLKSGQIRTVRLYNRPGDDYMRYKGDLWKISLSSFGFNDRCIIRNDIANLALLVGGNDNWNIESVVTFLKRGSTYLLLSRDFNVNRWLSRPYLTRFNLNLV